jgi:hypothetical protein
LITKKKKKKTENVFSIFLLLSQLSQSKLDMRERLVAMKSEISDVEQRVRRAKARLEFSRKARVEAANKEWQKNEKILTGLSESTEEGMVYCANCHSRAQTYAIFAILLQKMLKAKLKTIKAGI